MKISGFENIISINKFEYCAAVDTHEYCVFSCFVKDRDIDTFVGLIDGDISFEDDGFDFSAHVTDISYSKDVSGCLVEVKSIGQTYLFDKDKKNRIFQNEAKTLSDILSFLESMSGVSVSGDSDIAYADIIYQDNETDWEFTRRLCNSDGIHIFPGKKTFLGKTGNNTKEIDEADCIDYKLTVSSVCGHLYCRLKFNLSLGDKVSFSGTEYIVKGKKYSFEKEQYYYDYSLDEIVDESIVRETKSAYLDAVVTNNNDPDKKGRLQVAFETGEIEDCMKDKPVWIERLDLYASKGLGPVFIPNVGDKVRIHIYDGKAYVIGCIRNEAYGNPYQDSNNKYLILSDNIYFEYKEGTITLFNADNKIEVTEKGISIVVGEKSLISCEKNKICVSVDKSATEIASDINMTAGNVVVEAKSEASITATSVNIKGKSGVSIN